MSLADLSPDLTKLLITFCDIGSVIRLCRTSKKFYNVIKKEKILDLFVPEEKRYKSLLKAIALKLSPFLEQNIKYQIFAIFLLNAQTQLENAFKNNCGGIGSIRSFYKQISEKISSLCAQLDSQNIVAEDLIINSEILVWDPTISLLSFKKRSITVVAEMQINSKKIDDAVLYLKNICKITK